MPSRVTTAGPDSPTTATDVGAQPPALVPTWFEVITVTGVLLVATVGVFGLLLAVIGSYTTWGALLVGVPSAIVGSWATVRGRAGPEPSRAATIGAVCALALAIAFVAFASIAPSQNVLVGRDPGSYMNTARWLAHDGSLQLDARGDAFAEIDGLRFTSAAVYPESEARGETGELEFQFNHLASVVLAASFDVGGHRALFRLPAAVAGVGLLAVYAVAVRATRRPYVALVAPALLAVAMPMLFVARNTYSEPFAFALLWGAILVLSDLHRRPRAAGALAGGVLLGAIVCTRVDALLYVALVIPLAAFAIGTAPDPELRTQRLRTAGVALAALVPTVALGFYDLAARSGAYAQYLGDDIALLRAGALASVVVSAAALAGWLAVPRLRTLPARARPPLAAIVGVTVVAILLFGWFVRPGLGDAVRPNVLPTVTTIQERDGLPIEPNRTYAEQSLRWMSWYLGAPALAAAIAGFGVGAMSAIRRRAREDASVVIVVAIGLASGALYWWNPSITPDHLWATRRFVPAVFPALAVMAAYALSRGSSLVDRLLSPDRHAWGPRTTGPAAAVSAVVALALLIPPVLTSAKIPLQRTQGGFLQPVLEICDALPHDAAVIVVGSYEAHTLPQTLRGWCGVPVASQSRALTPETVLELAHRIESNGYHLHLVTAVGARFDPFLPVAGSEPVVTTSMDNRWTPVATLDRPPDRYRHPSEVLPDGPTPFALHLLAVPVSGSSR